MKRFNIGICVLAVAVASATAMADTVEIGAVKDNTLYEDNAGSLSNGSGKHLFAGVTAFGLIRRGVIAFDIAGEIPSGATIDSVTLTLEMSMTITGDQTVTLHRVQSDWGEGASDATNEEGAGAPSERGDATWIHTFFATQNWTTAGGDFDPASSASTVVGGSFGPYSWSSPEMVADVQSWLDRPTANFGWLIRGNESTAVTAKRFDSKDDDGTTTVPVLTVEFTPGPDVPSATATGLMLLAGLLMLLGTAAVLRKGYTPGR